MKRDVKSWIRRGFSAKSFLILGLALAVGLGFRAIRLRAVPVGTAQLERGTFVETLVTEGLFRAKTSEKIAASREGDLVIHRWKRGDEVKKGQTLARIQWDLKWIEVRSPMQGVVSQVFRDFSGPVLRGEPLLEVVDPHELEIVVELLTPDATRVEVGDAVKIRGWSNEPGQELPTEVLRVNQAAEVKPSALGILEEKTEVIIAMPQGRGGAPSLQAVGDRFHVEVEIEVSRLADRLLVPSGALLREGKDWGVFVVREGRASFQKIELEDQADQNSSVRAGLAEGDQVILYPSDQVRDGVRVKERPS
jgi:HlyD family secretion protein